jgi:hypothetical protein
MVISLNGPYLLQVPLSVSLYNVIQIRKCHLTTVHPLPKMATVMWEYISQIVTSILVYSCMRQKGKAES